MQDISQISNIQSGNKQFYEQAGLRKYPEASWRANKKPASTQAIKKLQGEVKKTISEFKNEIVSALKDKNTFPDAGKGFETLAEKFRANDSTLKDEMDKLGSLIIPKGVTSSEAGITFAERTDMKARLYKAENEIIRAKIGFEPSAENLLLIATKAGLAENGVYTDGANGSKIRELLLLDDIPSWLKTAAGLALPFIKNIPVIGPLAGAVGGMLGLGQDAGIDPADKTSIVSLPWTKQFTNYQRVMEKADREAKDFKVGFTDSVKELHKLGGEIYDMNVVNSKWVAGYLTPDNWGGSAMPQNQSRKVFSAVDTKVYQFSSDANGNVAIAIFPNQIFSNGSTGTQCFINQYIGWVRATGSFPSSVQTVGPLNPQQNLFSKFLISQFRITTRCLLSDLNNSGMTELTYFSDQATGLVPQVPATTFTSTSYKVLSNKCEGIVRQWPVFNPVLTTVNPSGTNTDNYFFIVFSGLPINTANCFEVVVSYSVDCTTAGTTNAASWLNFSYPDIGPATGPMMNSLLSQYPWLLFLSEQAGAELSSAILASKGDCVSIGRVITEHAEKHRATYSVGNNQRLNADMIKVGDLSFDLASN
jgi:hypothetical protein